MNLVRTSKFLSLILRHKPETVGIALDPNGWVDVDVLLAGMARRGHPLRYEQLVEVVETNNKKRFALSEDGKRIRAVQGHSRAVDLDLPPAAPPTHLYHGTVERFIPSIREQGLLRGTRQHVHLSPDRATATIVGKRRGQPIVLTIDGSGMAGAGHLFYLSENGVWLTEHVPVGFIVRWE